MASLKKHSIYFCIASFILLMSVSCNIDKKIKSDLKKIARDIKAKKTFNNNLLGINHKSKLPSLPRCTLPKLKYKIAMNKLKSKIKHPLPKLKPPKLLGLPKLPLLPPILPPFLPVLPVIPPLPLIAPLPLLPPLLPPPLLPLPILPPPLLPIPKMLKPLRLQKLKNKYSLQTALGSEIKPVKVPLEKKESKMLGKLLKLKRDGSLTTEEYYRFKKLLKL